MPEKVRLTHLLLLILVNVLFYSGQIVSWCCLLINWKGSYPISHILYSVNNESKGCCISGLEMRSLKQIYIHISKIKFTYNCSGCEKLILANITG